MQEDEISLSEAKASIRINRHALDQGLTEQPELFERVSYMAVIYASQRDQAKNNLAVVEAETASLIRQEFVEAGEKVTEATIKEELAQHKATKKAARLYLDAKKEADIWQSLKDAYEQRGRALRELASLYLAGYYQRSAIKSEQYQSSEANASYARKRLAETRRPILTRDRSERE